MPGTRPALGWSLLAFVLLALGMVALFPRARLPHLDVFAPAPATVRDQPGVEPKLSGGDGDVGKAEPAPEAPRGNPEMESFALRVRVVDMDDEPIDEARVFLRDKVSSTTGAWTAALPLESAVNADGLCELEGLPRRAYVLTIVSPRHTCGQVEASAPADEEVLVRLKDAPHVVGKAFVRDRSHPLRFGTIQFATTQADGSGHTRLSNDNSVRTDDDARFAVGPFALGESSVVLVHGSFQLEVFPVKLTAAEPVQEVEVIFKDGILVRGTVQNRDGSVLPGEWIFWRLADSDESTRLECRSDAEGRYEQAGLKAGRNRVELFGVALDEIRVQEVVLTEEPIQEVPIVVDCPPSVRVQVLTAAGEPAAAAEVTYRFSIPGRGGGFTADPLDSGGWTRIPCAPYGTELLIEVKAAAGPSSARLSYSVSVRNDPAILQLQAYKKVQGEVVDPEGRPVGDLEVAAFDVDLQRADGTKTGADGRFEFTLSPGAYRVEARAGNLGAASAEIEIIAGQASDRVRLELAVDPKRVARVRVQDADGEPLAGARVKLLTYPSLGFGNPTGSTDKEGWFSTACEPGEYGVAAFHSNLVQFELAKLSVPGSPVAEVRLEEPEARSVSGVVLRDGKPAAGARVGYGRSDGTWTHGSPGQGDVTDEAGRYSLTALRENAIYVLAWGEDFALARSELVRLPKRGRITNVFLFALPGTELDLKVEDPDGNPRGHVEVGLHRQEDPPFGWQGRTAEDGTIIVPRLPPGEYTVTFQSRSGDYLPSQRFVWDGSDSPITLRVERSTR